MSSRKVTRGNAIAILASSLILPSCGTSNTVRVGSKDSSENVTIAQVYSGKLELATFKAERRLRLGGTQALAAAVAGGAIDVYPEYTGAALTEVLRMPSLRDPHKVLAMLRRVYEKRFGATWLTPAPANSAPGLAMAKNVAHTLGIETLSQCASSASRLRLAADPAFIASGNLARLQELYRGFTFKEVRTVKAGLQYEALQQNTADVCTAFNTGAQIAAYNLLILTDDRDLWPFYHITPVVRIDVLRAFPHIEPALVGLSAEFTDQAVRELNVQVEFKKIDPRVAAYDFIY